MTASGTSPSTHAPVDYTGYALAIAGAVLFSTKGIFIKLAYAAGANFALGAETVLALRMVVAVPVYLAILFALLARRPELRHVLSPRPVLAAMAVGSLGYYGASFLDFSGLMFVTAQYERLVLFTYPFFTFFLGIAFFGDRMNWRVLPALGLSWLGLMVIFGWNLGVSPDGLWLGTALVLASGLTFALYQHLARRVMAVAGTMLFTCVGMTAAGVLAIAHDMVANGPASLATLSDEVWLCGLALGLLGTVLPSFMLNHAIARIGARASSAVGNFGPVMTVILAVIVLSEPFTVFHAIGTALVVAGGFWFGHQNRRG